MSDTFPRMARRLARWLNKNFPDKNAKVTHPSPSRNHEADFISAGLTPMAQSLPEDIFVAGYPKSGNTWFQTLVAGAVFGVLPEIVPMSVVLDLVPDVHASPYYKRHSRVMFFKTHHLPRPQYRRVIYLLRDGRDAMVSYWHYRQVTEQRSFTFQDFLKDDSLLFPCRWHRHVMEWFDNPYNAEMMLVRYEDLKADPVKELRRVCAFARVERSDEVLERAAIAAQFEKMQSKEILQGPFSQRWPKEKLFCRRGAVGSFHDEMPEDVLSEFTQESSFALRRTGYC